MESEVRKRVVCSVGNCCFGGRDDGQANLLIFSILNCRRMGCDSSLVNSNACNARADSTGSSEDNDLEVHKFIQRQRGDIFSFYHFSRVLSRGNSIIRQVLERNSKVERICKIKAVSQQLTFLRAFQEVEILKHLNHPNIVQIVQYFNSQGFLYLILEQVPGKTIYQLYLEDFLHSMEVVIEIIRQILIALSFCHQKGYVHKAINPENIMIVRLNTQSILVKLLGFGSAHKIGAPSPPSPLRHTLFKAPQSHNDKQASKQDIWGCGIIFLELLSRERNFINFFQKKTQIIQDILNRQNITQREKQIVSDFLQKMLEVDPSKRLTAEQALKHDLFQSNSYSQVQVPSKAGILDSLMHYRVEANLKSLFSMYASISILSVSEKAENLVQFYNLDKNKDGKIDFQELVEGIQNTFSIDPVTARKNVEQIFAQQNKPHDHCIEFHEFVIATTFMRKQMCEKTIKKLFDEIDTNKDHVISAAELSKTIEGINMKSLLREEGKEQLTYSDFREIMMDFYEQEQKSQFGSGVLK